MAGIHLYDYQLDAVRRMKNGCILRGGVGSGKSLTALSYYYLRQGGEEESLLGGTYFPMDIYSLVVPIGLCLRMLYAEGIRAIVETVRNSKGKIEFHIKANTDEALLRDLIERYNILIS